MNSVAIVHPDWKPLFGLSTRSDLPAKIMAELYLASQRADFRVDFTDLAPKFETQWEFPKERHWEYEPKDEEWCRKLGIGGMVQTDRPAIFIVEIPDSNEMLRRMVEQAFVTRPSVLTMPPLSIGDFKLRHLIYPTFRA